MDIQVLELEKLYELGEMREGLNSYCLLVIVAICDQNREKGPLINAHFSMSTVYIHLCRHGDCGISTRFCKFGDVTVSDMELAIFYMWIILEKEGNPY